MKKTYRKPATVSVDVDFRQPLLQASMKMTDSETVINEEDLLSRELFAPVK